MSDKIPPIARFPLLGAIKDLSKSSNRLDATIVTTFAFNGPFYEEVVLRSFERAGSRLNIVLVDARQFDEALADEMRRPRRAARDYILCPVAYEKAFHPKLLVLLSEKQRGLGVGSHNLTEAGYGSNEEVSTFWDLRDDAPPVLVEPALEYCLNWLERAHVLPTATFKDVARRLRTLAGIRSGEKRKEGEAADCTLALDTTGPLFETLRRHISAPVRRVIVAGPYFDQDLGFLRKLSETLKPKEIVVAIEPDMVLLGDPKRAPTETRFVDLAAITTAPARKSNNDPRFSHAKFVAIETTKGWVVSAGSANPTRAGWGLSAVANGEANIVLTGARASAAVNELGLARLRTARILTQQELIRAAKRSADQRKREEAEALDAPRTPLLSGRLDDGRLVIEAGFEGLDVKDCKVWTNANEPLDADHSIVRKAAIEIAAAHALTSGLYSLRRASEIIAFVLVHDDVDLRARTGSKEKTQLLASLGRLDQYEGFDQVFDVVVRHIVDAPPRARAASQMPASSRKNDEDDEVSQKGLPGPRGVSLADDRLVKARKRLFEQGLISDLISALNASLYTASVPRAPAIDGDAPDLDAEDAESEAQSGEDFATNIEEAGPVLDVDWPLVVRTCRRRTSALINRLKRKFEEAESDPAWELGKLLSVLVLVQKLRTIPPPSDLVLECAADSLIKMEQLQDLYAFAVEHVYGEGRLSARLAEAGDASTHERLLLDNQLLWYARELSLDCDQKISTAEEIETRDEMLQDRADLVVIAFSAAAGESEPWLKERMGFLARWADSEPVLRNWYERHRALGATLQVMLSDAGARDRQPAPVKDGGYAVWAGEPRLPRVVRSVGADKVTLFEPGGGDMTSFKLSSINGIDPGACRPS